MSMQSVLKSFLHFETKPRSLSEEARTGFVYILKSEDVKAQKNQLLQIIDSEALNHQKKELKSLDQRIISFNGSRGPVWILKWTASEPGIQGGLLDESAYAWFRDQAGVILTAAKAQKLQHLELSFDEMAEEVVRPMVIGLELAAYNFLSAYQKKNSFHLKVFFRTLSNGRLAHPQHLKNWIEKALIESQAVQVARHLVNLPPNELRPDEYEKIVLKEMKFPKTMQLTVWKDKKLESENMNLLRAVGQGSASSPRMIHLKYRPKKSTSQKPIAFVGKGITFDTGGLDLKPSSAMRLMKKDMGGSAAVLAVAYWVAHSGYNRPCDFYLALAENSVSGPAMRPSDVYRSRAGHLVEIDNTDAEGRLVLADVMDVAATKKGADEPEILIDIATLTGAIKVALGADIAGLFSNNDELADQLTYAGQRVGDLNWRMPLFPKYAGSLSSSFADFKNSADGFGGAITAALFLEKFCRGKKWAHLDVYSWNDKPQGALSTVGGSGQPVQAMIEWLKTL